MRARHAHPDALSVQAKLTALNLPVHARELPAAGQHSRRQALVPRRLLHRAARRRSRRKGETMTVNLPLRLLRSRTLGWGGALIEFFHRGRTCLILRHKEKRRRS